MNRYSAPWRVVPRILVGIAAAAFVAAAVLGLVAMTTGGVQIPSMMVLLVLSIACAIGSMPAKVAIGNFYANPALYTSIVTEIWSERFTADKTLDFEALSTGGGERYLMKLDSSSRDTYWIQNTDAHARIKPGVLVTIMRRLGVGREWYANVIAVTQPEVFRPMQALEEDAAQDPNA